MKHKRLKILGVVVVVALIGLAGWYGWQQSQDSNKNDVTSSSTATASSGKTTHITFTKDASLNDATKNEILQKVVDPMVVFYTTIIHQPLEGIKVSANKPMSADDFRFKLEYDGGSGFLFGANQQIGYWLPTLCDEGGKCDTYPESFKKAFPATYEAYQACDNATKANNKDASNLACSP